MSICGLFLLAVFLLIFSHISLLLAYPIIIIKTIIFCILHIVHKRSCSSDIIFLHNLSTVSSMRQKRLRYDHFNPIEYWAYLNLNAVFIRLDTLQFVLVPWIYSFQVWIMILKDLCLLTLKSSGDSVLPFRTFVLTTSVFSLLLLVSKVR